MDSVGEGEGGMIWENDIETCILPDVKYMTSLSSMCETAHSKPLHWDNPEGWGGDGSERGVQNWGTYVADSCQCMAKTTTIF